MATLTWLSMVWCVKSTFKYHPEQMDFITDADRDLFAWLAMHTPNADPWRAIRLVLLDYGQAAFNQEYRATAMAFQYLFRDKVMGATFDVVKPTMGMIQKFNPDGGMLFGDRGAATAKLTARNLSLGLEAAANWPGTIDELYYCFTREDDVVLPPDTSPGFISTMHTTLQLSEVASRVWSPLVNANKLQVLKQARRWFPQLFDIAFSCWLPVGIQPCGTCRHCMRFKMFEELTR